MDNAMMGAVGCVNNSDAVTNCNALATDKTFAFQDSSRFVLTNNNFSVNESHYDGRIQPLEFMQANMTKEEFTGFLKGNVIKYVSRAGKKQGSDSKDDLAKAERYLKWLIQVSSGDIIDPRKG